MHFRGILLLGVALVLGFISVAMLHNWLAGQSGTEAAKTAPVVVARAALGFGQRLVREQLREVDWPSDSLPPNVFSSIEELVGNNQERVVLRSIEANEPVLASKVSGTGGRATLSTIIDRDMRAVTIRVDDVYGVAGFVLPNDRVDVLLTRVGDRADPTTDVLLQNVRVLGIDQDSSDRSEKPKVARAVTLEVATAEAQKLTLGSKVGTLSLALRNDTNVGAAQTRTVGLKDLRVGAIDTPPPQPTPAPPRVVPATVEILRGTDSSRYELTRDGAVATTLGDQNPKRPQPLRGATLLPASAR
jgi:pilus assembly protein CpaB